MKSKEFTSEYRMAQWAQLLQERANSGLKVEEFCLSKGISRNSYFYWQKKLREATCERLDGMMSRHTGLAVQRFTEVMVSGSTMHSVAVQPDQVFVDAGLYRLTAGPGYPVEHLAKLLREVHVHAEPVR